MTNSKGIRKKRSIHSLLTLKRDPQCDSVILNRDINASKNILMLLEQNLYYNIRPKAFCRPPKQKKVLLINDNLLG